MNKQELRQKDINYYSGSHRDSGYRYKIVTFLYKLSQLMPVSNSFRCVCKFANRAAMHHKVNYIAPEGMSNGRQTIFNSSDLIFSSISLCSSSRFRYMSMKSSPLESMCHTATSIFLAIATCIFILLLCFCVTCM